LTRVEAVRPFVFAKKWLSEAKQKKSEAKLLVNNKNYGYFDPKIRFAFFASLRSAIFSEIQVDD